MVLIEILVALCYFVCISVYIEILIGVDMSVDDGLIVAFIDVNVVFVWCKKKKMHLSFIFDLFIRSELNWLDHII